MTDPEPKSSDLGTRVVSGIVMVVVSGIALWLGGMVWTIFVLAVGVSVWFEWNVLAMLIHEPGRRRTIWQMGGAIYCAIAAAMLISLRELPMGAYWVLLVVGAVVATDIGAYFAGRAIGGPKIAPSISPSKTWAGLFGGMTGAALLVVFLVSQLGNPSFAGSFMDASRLVGDMNQDTYYVVVHPFGGAGGFALVGAIIAILAQVGDFFESWMKRRAGVKDSGSLIPGHGGLFDRVDGLLMVLFIMGLLLPFARLTGAQ